MKNKKRPIQELSYDDFVHVIPAKELDKQIEYLCGKNEVKKFNDFMCGQTMAILPEQGGIYVSDFLRFLKYRKQGYKKGFPLDD